MAMARHGRDFNRMNGWSAAVVVLAAVSMAAVTAMGQGQKTSPDRSASQQTSSPSSSKQNTQSSATSTGPQAKQKSFSSPEKAADALYQAARNHDEKELLLILGPDARDIVMWTPDPDARKSDADMFVQKYGEMHRLVREPDDETTLYIGAENWPLPLPLVEKNGNWSFDAGLGRREILYRRIGRNESQTVDVLHALVDAENDYYSQAEVTDGVHEYARKFNSDTGKRDGLFWQGSSEPDQTPIGPYLAEAAYSRSNHKPLHGYFFRILTAQGPRARGGARNYIVDDKMTGGFAFVAFPAEYRSSGVMTFIVNQNDIVYEKDLGPMTAQIAKAMSAYNPDSTWVREY